MAKINQTTNYGLFAYTIVNRPLDLKKHRKLKASMQKYGFLASFPIVVVKDSELSPAGGTLQGPSCESKPSSR